MKAMQRKTTFAEGWEDFLDTIISAFNTIAAMCQVDADDKLKALPIMLQGDVLNYLSCHAHSCASFDEAIAILRRWYNSDDRKARILVKWQELRLSKAMAKAPTESEVAVFRTPRS